MGIRFSLNDCKKAYGLDYDDFKEEVLRSRVMETNANYGGDDIEVFLGQSRLDSQSPMRFTRMDSKIEWGMVGKMGHLGKNGSPTLFSPSITISFIKISSKTRHSNPSFFIKIVNIFLRFS